MLVFCRRFLLALTILIFTAGGAFAWPAPGPRLVPKAKPKATDQPAATSATSPNVPIGKRRPPTPPSANPPYAGPPPVATVHAVRTPPLRTMRVIPPPFRGEDDEMFEPPLPTHPTNTPQEDGSRQKTMGPVRSAPVSTGLSFEGIGAGMAGYSVSALPPDVNGHVGGTQYVQWNNLSFAIWDKQGNKLYGPAAGRTLFQPLGGVCASHNDGDPVVNYDVLAGRWILSQLVVYASPGFSHQCVAVSLTDDATGSWYLYDFTTDPVDFVDYPHMAVWPDGYYMAAHIFGGGGYYYAAGRIYAFERDKMLNGQPARMLSKDLKQYGGYPQYGFLAADLDSALPPPQGEAEFVIGPDPASTTLLDSTRVAVTWGATATITFTETQINASWGLAPCVNNSSGRDCVPQPSPASPSAYLDSLEQHMMYRLAYRNFGGSPVQESLLGNITVNGSSSTPAHGAIRWFEFRNDGTSTATPTVYQAGTFDPDNEYRWMGSIAMDKDHNIALGYSRSSTTTKPSIYVNGRLGTDPPNTLGTETLMMAGGGVQTAYNRWGDYTSMTIDPIDQCTFWYTGEYLVNNGTFNWGTRIAAFKFPSCTPTSWGQVVGTIASCATGAPIPGVIVSVGGYSGASDASGHYTIAVPAGTYTASAAAADRNCTSSSPVTVSVIVPTDGTVTQDFCMNGTSKIELGSVAINDTAAGNGNGVVNRNECFDLSVNIANNGCARESAISATLTTSTANVTVTQGNSFYPDLAAGASGVNSVPFKVSTSSSFVCGTNISLTLNLTYLGGSKAVNFTVPTCGNGGTQAIPTSTITGSDPTQGDRVWRDGVPSNCGGKTCPGGYSSGAYNYKTFKFNNASASPECITVTMNGACTGTNADQVETVAYLGSTYDPPTFYGDPKLCNKYLGDAGSSVGSVLPSVSFSFQVPAQSDFIIVTNIVSPGGNCNQFSGTVAGLIDNNPGPGPCPTCTPPATPAITPAGSTTFCTGGSVTLNSSAASGNQWYLNGGVIAGATGTSYVATASGSYTVTTTANSCISAPSSSAVVTVNPIPATPAPSNGGPFCAGSAITLSAPTVAGATYAWTGPNGFTSSAQNPTRANATAGDAGTYSVTVTVNGCTSPAGTTSVVVNPIPATPTAGNSGPFCVGGTIALSTPTVSGATYHWTGPNSFTSSAQNPTIANATAANAGTYLVTVTVNGCPSAGATTSVVVSSTPATPAASNSGPFCAGSTISLSTPTVSGATYAWTGPNGFTSSAQNPTRANAAAADAGAYSVTVTVDGCTSAAGTTNVVVNTAVPATPTAANSGPFCEGSTISLSTPAVASATYAWTGPNGFTSSQQNPTRANATVADGGTYSVTVTVGGCSSAAGTTSVAVTPTPAVPTASNGGPYCEGSTISLSTPLVASATYAWTGPNGFTSTDQNPTRASAAAADFGTYSVTVTVNGCTSAAGTTTVVDSNAAQAASNSGPFCAGDTISLSTPAVPGATYAWSGPNGFTSTDQNPTRASATLADAGMYSVIVTTSGCTSLAGSTNVVVNTSAATPVPANGGPYCAGGTISLSTAAVPGATYAWSGPNGFTSSLQNPTRANATLADAGTYSVIVFNGCTSAAGDTTVVVNAAPAAPAPSNSGPVCAGGTISLSTPAVASATYAWTGPNGFTSSQQNPTRANATAADAGTYSVTVTVDGCTSPAGTTSVVVNSIAAPLPANGGPYCTGSTIALAAPVIAGATYAWTGPNGFTSTLPNPTRVAAMLADAGTYSVTVTVNGCTSPAGTTTVVVNSVPTAPVPSNSGPYCAGSTISLSTSAVANATYAWTGPNGFTSAQQNPTIASATTANGGTYSVTVTVNGCTSPAGTTSVVVNAIPATPVASNTGPYCSSGTISLSTPAVTGATYSWTGPNSFTASVRNPSRQNVTLADAGTYSVTVTVNGCTSAAGTTSVVVNQRPATPTASNTGPYCAAATVQLNATTVAGATYSWTGPNGFTSSLQNPTIANATSAATGTYSVTASANGCTSPASSTAVQVTQLATPTIYNSGSTTFCAGSSVYLYSNTCCSGFQWRLDGTPIPGATNYYYYAGAAGSYTVVQTLSGCTTPASNAIAVTVTPKPDATITTASTLGAGAAGTATVADAGAGATYFWSISNGTVISGNATRSLTFTAGPSGAVSLTANVTAPGCSDFKSATVKILPAISSVVPQVGNITGGTIVTISGSGFQSGAAVFFGSTSATSVIRNSSTSLTATSPAHAAGAVNVVVTNPDTLTATRTGGFTYGGPQFDPNNDHVVDPADVFYLVNYLFTGGPAPTGSAGMMSGDANGDGVVDPADIFYLVNYLFTSGPSPLAVQPAPSGSVTLGDPIVRDGRTFIPVIVEGRPHAISLRVVGAKIVGLRRANDVKPIFEVTRPADDGIAWLVSFGENAVSGIVAEIEVSSAAAELELDPALTMLTDQSGTQKASVGNGRLRVVAPASRRP